MTTTPEKLKLSTSTRGEWRWVWGWIAVALAITSLPYLLGWTLATPEHRFSGFVYNVQDINTYLAKMQQGARGAWLFHLSYTSEPHRGSLFFLFYLALSHLTAWSGLPLELMYHLARLVCGAFLLVTVYRFAAAFTQRRAVRQITFLLVAFSGGLGWLVLLLARGEWLGILPLDLLLPEGFAFLAIYALPHIALAQALLLLAFLALLQALETERAGPALQSGLLALGVALVVPFYAGVFWAGAGAYLTALALWERRWPCGIKGWQMSDVVSLIPQGVYLPFTSQRRLVAGAQVPLALLAAGGLATLTRRAQPRRQWWYRAGTLGFMALTPLLLLAGNSLMLFSHPEPMFRQRSELEALNWLATHTDPQAVVLCAFETGNYVPARAGNRVFLGRGPETIQAEEKRKMVAHFFDAATEDTWRQNLLKEYRVAYVLIGPRERALGQFNPEQAPYLERVYANEAYQVFRIKRVSENSSLCSAST